MISKYTKEEILKLEKDILALVISNPMGWNRIFKSHPEFSEYLDYKYPMLNGRSLGTKIYWLRNNLVDFPVCPTCGKHYGQNMNVDAGGYPRHCSCRCTQLDKSVRAKNIETTMKLYGVENVAQSKIIQEKMKNTCIKKYGVDNIFKSEQCKKRIEEYNLINYGVRNSHQRPEIIEKTKQTNMLKYGKTIPSKFHANNISKGEIDLFEECKKLYSGHIIHNDREVIAPMELDIWFPEIKLGIEYDGDYWHSLSNMKKRDRLKTHICKKHGIKLHRVSESNYFKNKEQEILNIKKLINERLKNNE